MEVAFPLLFAAVVGFTHAFEADHLLAVSNIVTKRNRLLLAIKDGMYWGLGHTSTIFIIGLLMIVGKMAISEHAFSYFEAAVGFMLIVLGLARLLKIFRSKKSHEHLHDHSEDHRLAYGVGLVHGLAGSGTLIVLVMTQLETTLSAMTYLLIFGLGSVVGMLLASGVFSLPFSKRLTSNYTLQIALTLLSSVLCIGFGAKVIFENLAL